MIRFCAALIAVTIACGCTTAVAGEAQRVLAALAANPPYSRAQIVQTVANQGYFEIEHLHQAADGSWTCTALVDVAKRERLKIGKYGLILKATLLPPQQVARANQPG
jgi:hypothetical protein